MLARLSYMVCIGCKASGDKRGCEPSRIVEKTLRDEDTNTDITIAINRGNKMVELMERSMAKRQRAAKISWREPTIEGIKTSKPMEFRKIMQMGNISIGDI